ncbi:hypothetical protein KXX06_006749, partial [Aspergillus fumigatus]
VLQIWSFVGQYFPLDIGIEPFLERSPRLSLLVRTKQRPIALQATNAIILKYWILATIQSNLWEME